MRKRKFYIGFIDVISDDAPKVKSRRNGVLKLQNELAEYVKIDDEKVQIKVIK